MLSSELDRLTPIQSLFVEQALVMAKELETAVDSAPEGHVIDRCESFMLGFGRGFLRRMLESTIQLRAESLEKKAGLLEPARAADRVGTRAVRPKK
jgi:hypothetical protein